MFTIEQAIGMHYPKYEALHEANNVFKNSTASKVNIFIDAYNIIRSLYRNDITINSTNTAIVSGIINLCAHLRDYYARFYSVDTTIYIVYSDGQFAYNKNVYPRYDAKFAKQKENFQIIQNYVNSNLVLLKELCKFLPGIYFVSTVVEPMVKICQIIVNNRLNIPAIVFSKDPIMCQLPIIVPNAVVFKLSKINLVDTILTTTCNNTLLNYVYTTRAGVKTDINKIQEIPKNLYSCVVALTGLQSRNIPAFKTLNVTVKTTLEMLHNGKLDTTLPTGFSFYEAAPENIINKIDRVEFINRWKVIDLAFQLNIYNQYYAEAVDKSWLIDLKDPDAVRDINNRYFITNPLDLNRL